MSDNLVADSQEHVYWLASRSDNLSGQHSDNETPMTDQKSTERTKVSRHSDRGIYQRDEIYPLLDKSFYVRLATP